MESLVVTLFDLKHVKIGLCSEALKRITLLHVQDNLFRRVFSYNKKYLKYEKDALEEASSFSFLGCMSSSYGCVKAAVTVRRMCAKET